MTIKDVTAGRVVVEHDGSLTDLADLLQQAFPHCAVKPTGNSRYYGKDSLRGRGHMWAGFNEPSAKKTVKLSELMRPQEPWAPRQGETVEVGAGSFSTEAEYISPYKNEHFVYIRGEGGVQVSEVYPIPKTEVALADIAAWKNVSVDQIKIVL